VTLRDTISLGMSLPHRSPDPLALTTIGAVARRAEELGFRDLWVTENTVDEGTCLDPVVALTYAASITKRIGVGAAVIVLPVHHPLTVANQWATLDFVSGGRALLAVGLGRAHHYRDFQVPVAQRVRRFREEVELLKALWTEDKVTYRGQILQVENVRLATRPVRKPHPPIWMGVGHPDALRRAAALADGWMGSGGSSVAEFKASVPS
jgi:alkanesulfonate monooxygenase SsuD/methylene tetrahydromethanopterin reductase-like flavin-dependent oxidoreductase (luciferase family)